ncbi:MAG: glycosyl hydrolase family 28-related protein [Phycisphaerae bacterium]
MKAIGILAVLAAAVVFCAEPNWQIEEQIYGGSDPVITPFRASNCDIPSGGIKDASASIQKALNNIAAIGGGTLFLPAGEYRLDNPITIPDNTILRGDRKSPEGDFPVKGTIILACCGRDKPDSPALITLKTSSALKQVNIWYPEQSLPNVSQYPPTVRRGGIDVFVEDVTFVNSYIAFDCEAENLTARPFLRNICGTPLKTGIIFDNIADVGRVDNVRFSPAYWAQSALENAPDEETCAAWTLQHTTGLEIRRIDWSYFVNCRFDRLSRGIYARASFKDGFTPNGHLACMEITGCKLGIDAEEGSYAGLLFAQIDIIGAETALRVRGTSAGPIQLTDCTLEGSDFAVQSAGTSPLMVQDVTLRGRVSLEAGGISATDCIFDSPKPQVVLGDAAYGAAFNGSNPAVACAEKQKSHVYTNETPSGMKKAARFNFTATVKHPAPAREALYIVDNAAGDDTAAFENALAEAASAGGGTVFVPAGSYDIRRPLVIPQGTELRGVSNSPHGTVTHGSLINIRTGKNEPDAAAFISLSPRSGLRGLTFHYPEQIYEPANKKTGGFDEYPFMIRGLGERVYVLNVSATLPCRTLDLASHRCDEHYIDSLNTTAMDIAVQLGAGSRGGQLRNLQFNQSFYSHSARSYESIPGPEIYYLQVPKVRGFVFGDVSEEVFYNCFLYGSAVGLHLKEENGRGPSGYCLGFGADNSTTTILADAVGEDGFDMLNSQLVSIDNKSGCYIKTGKDFAGKLVMKNTACWGQVAGAVRIEGGSAELGTLNINSPGNAGFYVGSGARLTTAGSYIDRLVKSYCTTEQEAEATLLGRIGRSRIEDTRSTGRLTTRGTVIRP